MFICGEHATLCVKIDGINPSKTYISTVLKYNLKYFQVLLLNASFTLYLTDSFISFNYDVLPIRYCLGRTLFERMLLVFRKP